MEITYKQIYDNDFDPYKHANSYITFKISKYSYKANINYLPTGMHILLICNISNINLLPYSTTFIYVENNRSIYIDKLPPNLRMISIVFCRMNIYNISPLLVYIYINTDFYINDKQKQYILSYLLKLSMILINSIKTNQIINIHPKIKSFDNLIYLQYRYSCFTNP